VILFEFVMLELWHSKFYLSERVLLLKLSFCKFKI